MADKKNKGKKTTGFRLTTAGAIGVLLGAGLIGLGLSRALLHGENGGYYVAVLGGVIAVLVGWRSL